MKTESEKRMKMALQKSIFKARLINFITLTFVIGQIILWVPIFIKIFGTDRMVIDDDLLQTQKNIADIAFKIGFLWSTTFTCSVNFYIHKFLSWREGKSVPEKTKDATWYSQMTTSV